MTKIFMAAALLLAAMAWPVFASGSKVMRGRWLTWAGITAAFTIANLFGSNGVAVLFLAFGAVVWFEASVLQSDAAEVSVKKALAVFSYKGLAAGMSVLLALETLVAGPELTTSLVFIVALFDIGGWVGGQWLTGFAGLRRPLFPKISPNKTYGGLVGSLLLGWFANIWVGQFGVGQYLVIALFAVGGDWLESWVKRTVGVKDAGEWLPGFGGLMDRVDSILPMGLVLLIIGFYPVA